MVRELAGSTTAPVFHCGSLRNPISVMMREHDAVGDLLVLHDAGAYGASMSSNYNSRPLAPEVLIDGDSVRVIRRRQTIEDLLALERV